MSRILHPETLRLVQEAREALEKAGEPLWNLGPEGRAIYDLLMPVAENLSRIQQTHDAEAETPRPAWMDPQ